MYSVVALDKLCRWSQVKMYGLLFFSSFFSFSQAVLISGKGPSKGNLIAVGGVYSAIHLFGDCTFWSRPQSTVNMPANKYTLICPCLSKPPVHIFLSLRKTITGQDSAYFERCGLLDTCTRGHRPSSTLHSLTVRVCISHLWAPWHLQSRSRNHRCQNPSLTFAEHHSKSMRFIV